MDSRPLIALRFSCSLGLYVLAKWRENAPISQIDLLFGKLCSAHTDSIKRPSRPSTCEFDPGRVALLLGTFDVEGV